ncbi:MAG: VPLPA-CTERM sorting domain-containing protein [Candidatus Thiodiazotropha sp.]
MKRLYLHTIALLTLVFSSMAFAGTVIDAGSFDEAGDTYTTSPYSGIFTDIIKFDTTGLPLTFSGFHTGMAGGVLLLTNTDDGSDYRLDPLFSETLNLGAGSYVFSLSGFALNAFNSNIFSDYGLSITAVPLPAAIWLFGSALIGFVAFNSRRKI